MMNITKKKLIFEFNARPHTCVPKYKIIYSIYYFPYNIILLQLLFKILRVDRLLFLDCWQVAADMDVKCIIF